MLWNWKRSVTVVGLAAVALSASCKTMQEGIARVGQTLGGSSGSGSDTDATGSLVGMATGNSVLGDQVGAGAKALKAVTMGATEEEGLGQTVALKLSAAPGYVNDAALTAYVLKVGLAVASVSGRDDIDFTFGILNDKSINAISGPRGYVFVTSGLLKQCRDESELAGVLAHEIAHVARSHGLDTVKSGMFKDAAIQGAAAGTQFSAYSSYLATAADKFIIGGIYSNGQEQEADRYAVQYLKAANYDPAGFARLLEREFSGQGSAFGSHPRTANRVAAVRAAIGGDPGGQVLADRFATNVKF